MNSREEGFLLLGSSLGNPDRVPLTAAQLRVLSQRTSAGECADPEREMTSADLAELGYGGELAERILRLLEDTELLHRYLRRGKQGECIPLTRVSEGYPLRMRRRLGADSPGVLWAKGDISLLAMPSVALVGSRDIHPENREFAAAVGCQAAKQGFVLISGNARGADRAAQSECLAAGGRVISVVADELQTHPRREGVLYLSEGDFDQPFSAPRALSRNRVIHALGNITMVAQCGLEMGGTWSGTAQNLRSGWSDVFCFQDGSAASLRLEEMGATLIGRTELGNLAALQDRISTFFDQ